MAKPGLMRHRVTFEQRSTDQDASGEPLDSWTEFAERWAEIVPQSAREFFDAQQRNARVSTLFRLRSLAGLVPSMRARWNGKTFDVLQVIPELGAKNELLVLAEELLEEAEP